LWKLEEDSKEYNDAIKLCHKRAAERLLVGCLKNGGLYVKLGQGLVSLNHLPIYNQQKLLNLFLEI
jgi:aarF domain-containing kinase